MEEVKNLQDVQETKDDTKETVVKDVDSFFDTDIEKLEPSFKRNRANVDLSNLSLELLFDLELVVSVELARKNMLIRDILQLGEGSIIEFEKLAGENAELMINDKKIAEGEVVVIDDRFGVRITSLLNPAERLKGITQ